MTPLRLVLVTRRYWPLAGGAASAMAALAGGFCARGAQVTILAARWQPKWPAEIHHHGARIVRLPHSARRGWGTYRFGRAMAAWLRHRADMVDLVYVSGLMHDAAAAQREVSRGGFHLVLRAERPGLEGDCHWQLEARFGHRIKRSCARASAIVASTPLLENELIAAGYPRDRIHFCPLGVPPAPSRGSRLAAGIRAELARAHPALGVGAGAPLVVTTGGIRPSKGLGHLLQAWPAVAARWPDARLWLLGDGPLLPQLRKQIDALGIAGSVVLPGVFDQVSDVLLAADVFVYPALEPGSSLSLLEAMVHGLPIVASAIAGNQHLLQHGENALLVPCEQPPALSSAVLKLLDDQPLAARLAAAARLRALQDFSLEQSVREHWKLFEGLVRQPAHTTLL